MQTKGALSIPYPEKKREKRKEEKKNNTRICLCSTNISLSFPGIYTFQKRGMVRVGGRSSSEILKQFTLKELRKKSEFRHNLPMHLRRAYVNVRVEFTGNDGIGLPVRGRN